MSIVTITKMSSHPLSISVLTRIGVESFLLTKMSPTPTFYTCYK